jgi:hypothetical protein
MNKERCLSKRINKTKQERYFFNYAFPCVIIKLGKGEINKQQFEELKRKFEDGEAPTQEELEQFFKPAFERIKKLAGKMNKDYFDMEVLREYWTKEHNNLISMGEGKFYNEASEAMKDLCKVHKAEIIDKKTIDNQTIFSVRYDKKHRNVFATLVPDLEIGDKVRIHYHYAIEEVD